MVQKPFQNIVLVAGGGGGIVCLMTELEVPETIKTNVNGGAGGSRNGRNGLVGGAGSSLKYLLTNGDFIKQE